MAKNEVTVKETTAVAATETPVVQIEIDRDDMIIPFFKVIQSLSEEVMQGKDKYDPNVKAGDIYDSVTKTICRDAKVVITGLRRYYAEWTPEVRGRLVGKHKTDSPAVLNAIATERVTEKGTKFLDLSTPEGNQLVETYGVVMIIKNGDGTVMPGVLTLSKTTFMVGKQLSSLIAMKQAKGIPVFSLSTTVVSNSKGSWYKPVFNFDSYETDEEVVAMMQGMAPLTESILLRSASDEAENAASASVDIGEGLL